MACGVVENRRPGNAPKVIVCAAAVIVTLCGTVVAALKFASPACVALIVQVPPETMVTVVPATVQTAGVADT